MRDMSAYSFLFSVFSAALGKGLHSNASQCGYKRSFPGSWLQDSTASGREVLRATTRRPKTLGVFRGQGYRVVRGNRVRWWWMREDSSGLLEDTELHPQRAERTAPPGTTTVGLSPPPAGGAPPRAHMAEEPLLGPAPCGGGGAAAPLGNMPFRPPMLWMLAWMLVRLRGGTMVGGGEPGDEAWPGCCCCWLACCCAWACACACCCWACAWAACAAWDVPRARWLGPSVRWLGWFPAGPVAPFLGTWVAMWHSRLDFITNDLPHMPQK